MSHSVCPHWVGYLLVSPFRRLVQNPDRILAPWVTDGMTILEVGPGMGFFTLSLARRVGPGGKIVCVDVQQNMLQSLQNRARQAGLADRILTRACEPTSLGVEDFSGQIDFVLAFAVVHEVPNGARLFAEIARVLKPGARCLVAEPKMHVSAQDFEQTLATAVQQGLHLVERPRIAGSRAALLASRPSASRSPAVCEFETLKSGRPPASA